MHKIVYLSLGSNLGDRSANLRTALEKLADFGTIAAVSSFYETEPVELAAQPWFLNCAAKLDTEKMPRQLIAGILNVEKSMGVSELRRMAPRIIDIDILLFGTSVIDIPSLTVPHPNCTSGGSCWSHCRNCPGCPASGIQKNHAAIARCSAARADSAAYC